MNVLRLCDEADGPFGEVVPYVDGRSLVALVEAFEALVGYDDPGTYAGLPRNRAFDPDGWLPQRRGWPGRRSWGTADVLACACGEPGCWALRARISAQGGLVVWDRFEQPYRPDRGYTLLGSFVFDAVQYARALRTPRGGWLPAARIECCVSAVRNHGNQHWRRTRWRATSGRHRLCDQCCPHGCVTALVAQSGCSVVRIAA